MKTYILNTPILTRYGQWHYEGPLSVLQAQKILTQGFVSAVGHQASAEFLSYLLDTKIEMNRIQITMERGDIALVLNLTTRLPENLILTDKAQIEALPYELGLLKYLK